MKSLDASSNIENIPALKVLTRSRVEGRMPHAILFTGQNSELLLKASEWLAGLHLETDEPLSHADCRALRPAKRSRRINMESTQEVVADLRLTSTTGRRVVIIYEVDRFASEAANCFLKTLEEPPAGTLIIMQTTNYYRVLPTVLSRSLRFHLGGEQSLIQDPSWNNWLKEFENFINKLATTKPVQNRSTEIIIPLYSLCARFEVLLELFVEETIEKAPPPPVTDDEDKKDINDAYEETIRRGIWNRMLVAMEEKLRLMGRSHPTLSLQIASTVTVLESCRVRLELSYPRISAMENSLLQTLRIFSNRPPSSPS
jgi:DNA polymerase III subunit delta'